MISICMAVFNVEDYISSALNSILNQTYQDIRLIISDDCSKDNTRKILKEYEKKDDRVKVYYQEKNFRSNISRF